MTTMIEGGGVDYVDVQGKHSDRLLYIPIGTTKGLLYFRSPYFVAYSTVHHSVTYRSRDLHPAFCMPKGIGETCVLTMREACESSPY